MSIPGDISRGMEDSLLGRQSEPTAGDKVKEGIAQSMGLAIAERLRWREDTQNGRYPDKNIVSPDDGHHGKEASGNIPTGPQAGGFAQQAMLALSASMGDKPVDPVPKAPSGSSRKLPGSEPQKERDALSEPMYVMAVDIMSRHLAMQMPGFSKSVVSMYRHNPMSAPVMLKPVVLPIVVQIETAQSHGKTLSYADMLMAVNQSVTDFDIHGFRNLQNMMRENKDKQSIAPKDMPELNVPNDVSKFQSTQHLFSRDKKKVQPFLLVDEPLDLREKFDESGLRRQENPHLESKPFYHEDKPAGQLDDKLIARVKAAVAEDRAAGLIPPDKRQDNVNDKSAFYRDAKKRLFDDKPSGRTEIEEPQVDAEDEFV